MSCFLQAMIRFFSFLSIVLHCLQLEWLQIHFVFVFYCVLALEIVFNPLPDFELTAFLIQASASPALEDKCFNSVIKFRLTCKNLKVLTFESHVFCVTRESRSKGMIIDYNLWCQWSRQCQCEQTTVFLLDYKHF